MAHSEKSIAVLQHVHSDEPFRYTNLTQLAANLRLKIDHPDFGNRSSLEDARQGWSETEQLVNKADGFVLGNLPFEHVPDLVSLLHHRINAGARAVIVPNRADSVDREKSQEFLQRYYMEPLWVKLVGPSGERHGVTFNRNRGSLGSPELFSGVDRVIVDTPFAIRAWGEACPIVIGDDDHWGVDSDSDLPSKWNGRQLTCMAVWYGHGGGAMLAINANGVLTDPITVLAGPRPGIEANTVLAKNILRFLSHADPSDRLPSPEQLCDRIEQNLADFVLGVLRATGPGWWEHRVPEAIRSKVAEQLKSNPRKLQKECFLYLIDWKNLMRYGWDLFQHYFAALGKTGGKSKALAFMDRLNDLRNVIKHPTKRHLSGYRLTWEDEAFLLEVDALISKLPA